MSSTNRHFLGVVEEQATKIVSEGGINNASIHSYMLKEEYGHIDFDEAFNYISNLISEVEDDSKFIVLASDFAMDYVIDFDTLMTIVTVELAFRVATSCIENGLEQIH